MSQMVTLLVHSSGSAGAARAFLWISHYKHELAEPALKRTRSAANQRRPSRIFGGLQRMGPTMRFCLIAVLSGFLLWGSAAHAQSTATPNRDQLFTSDLISWTEMQSPDPVDNSGQRSPQQNSAIPVNPTQNKQPERPTQTFTGTITKEGNSYVLRISDKWFYDLDDQSEAEQYLNQRVAVTGSLNESGDLIHVHLIQPVS
jgi:hypothetical protein